MLCEVVYVIAHDDVRVVSSLEENHQGYSTDPQKIHTQDTGYRTTADASRGERREKERKAREIPTPRPDQAIRSPLRLGISRSDFHPISSLPHL
jgi:hypothetical protein